MSRAVTLKNGLANITLPNGNRYSGGAVVMLSDAEYSTISPAAKAALFSSDTAAPGSLPAAQSFPLGNLAYQDIVDWTVTGQTNVTAPFGIKAGSIAITSVATQATVQGPAFWFGYNPSLLSGSSSSSANGAVGMSCFGDAGDTDTGAGSANGGDGKGLEFNPACFVTPNGQKATNALEMVAVNDNTNTVTLALRCGTGQSGSGANTVYSEINFSNADGSVSFGTMSSIGGAGNITWYQNNQINISSGDLIYGLNSAAGNSFIDINCASGKTGGFEFKANNVPKAQFNYYDNSGVVALTVPGGNVPLYASSSLCYSFMPWQFCSGLAVSSNTILAASATSGFISIPTINGAPTGSVTPPPASASMAYDNVNHKIWVTDGTGWKGVAVA